MQTPWKMHRKSDHPKSEECLRSWNEIAPGMAPEIAPEDEQMFVASVPDKINGAGVIAYPNFMEDAAQKLGG